MYNVSMKHILLSTLIALWPLSAIAAIPPDLVTVDAFEGASGELVYVINAPISLAATSLPVPAGVSTYAYVEVTDSSGTTTFLHDTASQALHNGWRVGDAAPVPTTHTLQPGANDVTVCVDYTNTVAESDESNNCLSITITL